MKKVMFSSQRSDWETPQDLFDKLNAEFNFTLDSCASAYNAKCRKYFTRNMNLIGKSALFSM